MACIAFAACLSGEARAAPARRGMYVRDAVLLTATPPSRARLDRLLDQRSVTEVIPYNLGPMLATIAQREGLALWIDELHRHGARVIVPVAGHDRLRALATLFAEHPATWIDGMVTEVEFWNRSDRAIAFEELIALVADMRISATVWQHGGKKMPIGVYLGYPDQAESARLAAAIDFAYADYSVDAPARAWSWVHAKGGPLRQRFAWLASAGVDVWPIFYAAGEVDMVAALRADGTGAAEARFRADLVADPDFGRLVTAGFVYFTFEAMPDPR
ncbi:MAG: hypothetical protein ABI175_04225 [Polyangiales bacterium]